MTIDAVRHCRTFPSVIKLPFSANPYHWLAAQRDDYKLIWGSRGHRQITGGLGAALSVEGHVGESAKTILDRCREMLVDLPNQRFFGGFTFHRQQSLLDTVWQPFGNARFWLPRLSLGDRTVQIVVLSEQDQKNALEFVEQLREPQENGASDELWPWTRRHNQPDFGLWNACIQQAMQMFQDEALEKIVLARRVDLTFGRALDPISLLERLSQATPACYHFCFQLGPHVGFVGASPERLFFRRGRFLESEVVAGTRPRGCDVSDDQRLAAELLDSAKDQLEHDIVRKSIRQRLHACVTRLEVDAKASLLKLANKQHLFSRVSGTLRDTITDGDLIDRLHPTPAVGGYPTENALTEIRRLEHFERGWYAAPVGWVGSDEAEFAVAIRSGLVTENRLSLFSGAGIVPGSTAEAEWAEIEHKLTDFLQLFHAADPASALPILP
jgi:menaquinone-specific isochorismate synthase